ncbi:MAG: hypothetical protein ACI8PP_002155 [Candidatus Pseudothioglobus sp.]|jgi:hypothetical protein
MQDNREQIKQLINGGAYIVVKLLVHGVYTYTCTYTYIDPMPDLHITVKTISLRGGSIIK